MERMKKRIITALIIMGVTSIIAQTTLLRELLVVFSGNELCIGAILGIWLIWEAAGAGLASRLLNRIKNETVLFVFIQLLISIILPSEVLAVKLIKNFLHVGQGETMGFVPVLGVSFVMLFPLCVLFGIQFTAACKLSGIKAPAAAKSASSVINDVYTWEAIGWVTGGVLFTYCLGYLFNSFQIALLVTCLNVLTVFLLTARKKRILLSSINLILLVPAFLLLFTALGNKTYRYFLEKQWSDEYKLVESRDSIYGNITVRERLGQFSFYENGVLTSTSDDVQSNEETVHFAMLQHPWSESILLIGGGISGALGEILKYPYVKTLYYAELDPMVVKLGKKYIPLPLFSDPRVKIVNTDGRLFIKTRGQSMPLDCIIISLPDPSTAQLNRFYTLEFFKEVRRVLRKTGVFSISLSSSPDYISEELEEFNGSVYRALKIVFPNILIIPGPHTFFICSQERFLTKTVGLLSSNLTWLKNRTKYISEEYLRYRLDRERMKYFNDRLGAGGGIERGINSDFKPVSYYHNIALWVSSFNIGAKNISNWLLRKVNGINVFIITLLLILSLWLSGKNRAKRACFVPVITTGFVGISIQIIIIFLFQVFYGYVYLKIGMITAAYMVGLFIGSKVMNVKEFPDAPKWLGRMQFSMSIYALILPAIFTALSRMNTDVTIFVISQVLFPLLTMLAGFFTGSVFSLSNMTYISKDKKVPELMEAGTIYALDLIGASAGAFVSGVFFIPLLGINQTCLVLGAVLLVNSLLFRVFKT